MTKRTATFRAKGALTSESMERELEAHRTELTAYAYRMLGSSFEADDAVQDTMVRAWRSLDQFEGRAALRSWLYRIATNVCLDMLNGRNRRAMPMDLGPAKTANSLAGDALPEVTWIEPVPDHHVVPAEGDPAEIAETRESIRLAFIAALQYLAPRQRVVLILREVLRWKATEVADLLDTTTTSVNSALQRARATLANSNVATDPSQPMDDEHQALLARYVDAFERYDLDSLTALLHDDATWSMPPYELWLQGPADISAWCLGPGIGCRGSRLVPTTANGSPAFGQYRPDPAGGYEAWALHVVEMSDGLISAATFFLDTGRVFPLFDLPLRLDG